MRSATTNKQRLSASRTGMPIQPSYQIMSYRKMRSIGSHALLRHYGKTSSGKSGHFNDGRVGWCLSYKSLFLFWPRNLQRPNSRNMHRGRREAASPTCILHNMTRFAHQKESSLVANPFTETHCTVTRARIPCNWNQQSAAVGPPRGQRVICLRPSVLSKSRAMAY